MTNAIEHTAQESYLRPVQETPGKALLRWGALVALVIETVLVLTGIISAFVLH